MSQKIEYENGFQIVNNYPDFKSDLEFKKRKQEILIKLYNLFFNKNKQD